MPRAPTQDNRANEAAGSSSGFDNRLDSRPPFHVRMPMNVHIGGQSSDDEIHLSAGQLKEKEVAIDIEGIDLGRSPGKACIIQICGVCQFCDNG